MNRCSGARLRGGWSARPAGLAPSFLGRPAGLWSWNALSQNVGPSPGHVTFGDMHLETCTALRMSRAAAARVPRCRAGDARAARLLLQTGATFRHSIIDRPCRSLFTIVKGYLVTFRYSELSGRGRAAQMIRAKANQSMVAPRGLSFSVITLASHCDRVRGQSMVAPRGGSPSPSPSVATGAVDLNHIVFQICFKYVASQYVASPPPLPVI